MKPPIVSVIIPFHNRFEWTLEAIQSVIAQTFQDFEIILVDDGSTENSNIRWTDIDLRVQYLRLDKCAGPSIARNAGITQSHGEFIAFLDSDDAFLPEKLEIQVNVMRAFPSLALSYTGAIMMDRDRKAFGLFPVVPSHNVYPYIWEDCSVLTPCVMIRRELVPDLQFAENLRVGEDLILWARISSRFPLLGVEAPLSKVRFLCSSTSVQHQKSITHLEHVIHYGVEKDQDLGLLIRHRILSNLNILIASHYLRLRRLKPILKHLAIAFWHYPFNPRFLRLTVKYSMLGKLITLEHPKGVVIPDENIKL
jgi:glycosyltransferase involved in cell wall biosynthesis